MKNVYVYYALFFCFGFLVGFHRFYLGPEFRNSGLLFALTFGGAGLWAVLDLFRGSKLVAKANKI